MDATVRTGSTKAPRETSLTALALTSAQDETVVLLMEIEAKNRDAKTIERECENVVRHALLETEGSPSDRLDGTLKELNGLLKGMLLSRTIDDVHMLIAVLDPSHTLHVSHAGRAEGYLIRKGVASQVTEYTTGKPTPAFIHIASGALESKDVVLLSTQRLLRTLTPAQLAKAALEPDLLSALTKQLESEGEHAALASINVASAAEQPEPESEPARVRPARALPARRNRPAPGRSAWVARAAELASAAMPVAKSLGGKLAGIARRGMSSLPKVSKNYTIKEKIQSFASDLRNPKRKRKAHFLLLAGAVAALLIVWVMVHLFTNTQRSKTRAELEALVGQITEEIQTAENRRIIGDMDAANAILQRAEERAKQVMDNETGLYRVEALDLLDRIRGKKEEINNISRVSPRLVANLGTKTPDVVAQGLIGLNDGEFIVYDRQNLYRVLLNAVENPSRLSETELIIDGESNPRYQSLVFLTTGNSVVEIIGGQPVAMKTEDPKGWVSGKALQAYLRFLYVLAPQDKQIYKYERLSNRYGAPVGYNVNGDLTGAIDMAIDGNVYILKEGGTLLKLFRGEAQPFVIRRAPDGVLKNATKVFKVPEGHFYVLDPVQGRVIVISDGGATGEATYVKQYALEGEQIGTLKDLYVDPDEAHLYVLDDKRVFVIDLVK